MLYSAGMPFDASASPGRFSDRRLSSDRPVALWLFAMAGMIFVMVGLGGATRLTGSGLSIMEWAPLSGALPPLSHAAWEKLFALYRTIPQSRLLHPGMGLAGFRHLFWLEYVHRLWGRLMGVAFLAPLLWFAWRGQIGRRLGLRLAGLFVLGGLQGAVGWFMVASGFAADAVAVAPVRLMLHLGLALALYAAILWTALGLARRAPAAIPGARSARRLAVGATLSLALTMLAGSLVAGTHAGFAYNSFPLMEGHLVPPDYAALHPFARNLVANLAAVQFDHRLLATLTLLVSLAAALAAARLGRVRRAAMAFGALVVLQYGLGIATLLLIVPTGLAVIHQLNAVLALTAALVLLHGLRGAAPALREPA